MLSGDRYTSTTRIDDRVRFFGEGKTRFKIYRHDAHGDKYRKKRNYKYINIYIFVCVCTYTHNIIPPRDLNLCKRRYTLIFHNDIVVQERMTNMYIYFRSSVILVLYNNVKRYSYTLHYISSSYKAFPTNLSVLFHYFVLSRKCYS